MGLVVVSFSREIVPPDDFNAIDEKVLKLSIITANDDNKEKLGFTWKVTEFNSTLFSIQLFWDQPSWVSSTLVRDRLLIEVPDIEKFFTIGRSRRLEGLL